MTREQLEHLIRAAALIADDDTIVVIGSQAILGQFPDAPAPMRVSMEADLFPLHHPDRAQVIEGSIGELSPFHETFGYYAEGVGEETAYLPDGWKERLVLVQNENTRGAVPRGPRSAGLQDHRRPREGSRLPGRSREPLHGGS